MNNNELIKNTNIIKFANKVSANVSLEIIPVQVEQDSIKNECYNNVEKKINKDGGTKVCGWCIHIYYDHTKNISMIEAEAHAIWEDSNNNRICISPQQDTEIIFLEDKNDIVKDNITIPNYRCSPLGNTINIKKLELLDYIRIEAAKFIELNLIKIPPTYQLVFTKKDNYFVFIYNNQEYAIKDVKVINLLQTFLDIHNFQPITINFNQFIKQVSNKLNYKFKYCIEL